MVQGTRLHVTVYIHCLYCFTYYTYMYSFALLKGTVSSQCVELKNRIICTTERTWKKPSLYDAKKLHGKIRRIVSLRTKTTTQDLLIWTATNSTLAFRFNVLLISDLENEKSVIWQAETITELKIQNLKNHVSCHAGSCE